MKYTIFVLMFVFISSYFHICAKSPKNIDLDSILTIVNQTIKEKDKYVKEKEKRISDLNKFFEMKDITLEQIYEINTKLYSEYKSFIPDSAIGYQQRNIGIAQKLNNRIWVNNSKTDLAQSYAIVGMYTDAEKLLNSIEPDSSGYHQYKYYESYKQLAYFYSSNPTSKHNYQMYRDSLLAYPQLDKNTHNIIYSEKLIDMGKYDEARALLFPMFEEAEDGSNWSAVLAYTIGESYKGENNYKEQMRYYAISAISDIKNVIRVNASMRMLAVAAYETNDIEHAYIYAEQSMDDVIMSNSYLRTMEMIQIFSIVEKTYQQQMKHQRESLFSLVICISILSLFLIATVIYIFIQFRRLTKARSILSSANQQLHDLNQDLKSQNRKITDLNKDLYETNLLKETYISQFLNICSMYINKLEKYRSTLNKKAMDRKLDELYAMLKSKDLIENELKSLYEMFDNVFLHLYPNFVEQFNELLQENEQIELKTNELLTTELRIFALIRLGITDSSRIADFLHYSATTIYNYRTRVRNKAAIPRDEFEDRVMKIGVISLEH